MVFDIFAMPSSATVLLLSAAFGITGAKPWAGPAATATYKVDEWSPRPTQSALDARALFKRNSVDVAVCGWAGGIQSNAQICPTGSSCIHDFAHGAVGCCPIDGNMPCTAVYTTCVDKNSPGGTTGPVVQNNGVFTCPQDSLCYKNSYPANFYQWGCGSSNQATTVETTFSGQPTDLALQIVYMRITFTPTTVTSTSTSSSSSSASSSSSTDSNSSTSSSSTTDSSGGQTSPPQSSTSQTGAAAAGNGTSKSLANPGVIAAGVLGTSAFIIALACIALFFLRRRRAQQSRSEGSFMSNLKGDGASTPGSIQGNFTRLPVVPYGPDDFVSPLPTADSTRSQAFEQARGFEGQAHDYEGQAHTHDEQAHEFDGQGNGYDAQTHAREAEAYEPHSYEAQPYEAQQPYDSPYVPPIPYTITENDLHPVAATPPDPNMFSPTPYIEIRARAAENAVIPVAPAASLYYGSPPQLNTDGLPSITEFENFSTSFHAAVAQISPPTPPQAAQMPNLGPAPTSAPKYPGIGANMGGGIGASVIAGIKNSRNLMRAPTNEARTYSPISGGYPEDTPSTVFPYPDLEDDDDFDDEAAAELKEMGMAQALPQPPGYTVHATETAPEPKRDNVRQEAWQPVELQPNSEQLRRLSEETRRYQLVDRAPTTAKVLHSAGQKAKGQRDKQAKSKDVSKGELEE